MNTTNHYYGDIVRVLFVTAGLIMLASYPFFSSFINLPVSVATLACIALAVFGGLMSPEQKWVMVSNTLISIAAFVIFQYSAVQAYMNQDLGTATFFWFNQTLSLIFFFAAYLSTKTFRGSLLEK